MNKKLAYFLLFFVFIVFLYFLNPPKIFADFCTVPSYCEQFILTPQSPVCCHNTGGCETGSMCGHINWYDYCKVSECCASIYNPGSSTSCSLTNPSCWSGWYYHYYVYAHCSAVDTCFSGNGPYLNAGVCGDSGCEKGGIYKICCSTSGGICPHACSGSNYSGTCGSGCQAVIGNSCSGGTTPPPGGGGSCGVVPYNNACPRGYVLGGGCCTCP